MLRSGFLAIGVGLACAGLARGEDSASTRIPEPFARFEQMIGSWKGTAVPAANRLKGWSETHVWAWRFVKGTPVGMSVELKGDRTLARAQLSYAADTRQYRLEGTDPAGKPVAFVGALDRAGKALVLGRAGSDGGKDRLLIRPNSNLIRYTMELDHQEPGAPQFAKVIEVGLTKEGESFAAGGSAANLPRCILTGGAATMSVSYQGKSYPVCCSGCRDEFNEDPAKYVKKAALMATQTGAAAAKRPASRVGNDDGAFDGLVDEPAPSSRPAAKAKPQPRPKSAATRSTSPAPTLAPAPAAAKSAARAATKLRLGQDLEKAGKTAPAIQFYREVVKDYPGTSQARTAAARIKALEKK
jgi:YHS domain-containing protein